jgi:transketolase
VHGAPLGDAEIAAARAHIGWSHAPFEIPADVYAGWDAKKRGAEREATGTTSSPPTPRHSRLAAEFKRRMAGELPAGWAAHAKQAIETANAKAETVATRKASQIAINALAPALPEFLGGSADLTGSNLTNWSGCKAFPARAPATTFPTACASSAWRRS